MSLILQSYQLPLGPANGVDLNSSRVITLCEHHVLEAKYPGLEPLPEISPAPFCLACPTAVSGCADLPTPEVLASLQAYLETSSYPKNLQHFLEHALSWLLRSHTTLSYKISTDHLQPIPKPRSSPPPSF